MALGPRLDLRQTQSLVMTPQLQQAIKLLALPSVELEAHIGQVLEANPFLEMGDIRHEPGKDAPEPPASEHEANIGMDGIEALDGAPDPDSGDWSAGGTVASATEGMDIGERAEHGLSLADHLDLQIGLVATSPAELFVARHIIGELEDTGYLARDLASIAAELDVPRALAEQALARVQSLDPAGIGARSLAECLMLQAKDADRYDPCMARLIDNLDSVAAGDIARLKRLCDVDDDDLADMIEELRGYDPKPGCRFSGGPSGTIVPDVLVTPDGDGWHLAINEASLPRLVVNRTYHLELRAGALAKATRKWLDEQLAEADWLIRALDQRQKTILKTASAILSHQEGFLRNGVRALRSLTLRDVAETIDMHESTVSRVTRGKYLACPRGTFELKYFFSSGVSDTSAEGDASARAVQARIRAMIDAELEGGGKVLSDQAITDRLAKEGFALARRTVAKYREAIGIGSSAQRRRAAKLRNL